MTYDKLPQIPEAAGGNNGYSNVRRRGSSLISVDLPRTGDDFLEYGGSPDQVFLIPSLNSDTKLTDVVEGGSYSIPKRPLKVLLLSADTGGGHRASAESLINQFMKLAEPGTECKMHDIWTTMENTWPYNTTTKVYTYLSARPLRWGMFYHLSNWGPIFYFNAWNSIRIGKKITLKRIRDYNPDIIVSVHPMMQEIPRLCTKIIAKETGGSKIPMHTVVTDLGSGHRAWFYGGCDKMFIASDRIGKLAISYGSVKSHQMRKFGLPIREAFAKQNRALGGDRTTSEAKSYQFSVKKALGEKLVKHPEKPLILVMGGGEGVGSLSKIVGELHRELTLRGKAATISVVCGRNTFLQEEITARDWSTYTVKKVSRVRHMWRKWRSTKEMSEISRDSRLVKSPVDVVGLGFIKNMDEWMVAATILISKAGPGSIAEAASVGLPILLTGYMPGQEAGNVNVVVDGGFGEYHRKPRKIAKKIDSWLACDDKLDLMSRNAMLNGEPDAAKKITEEILDDFDYSKPRVGGEGDGGINLTG